MNQFIKYAIVGCLLAVVASCHTNNSNGGARVLTTVTVVVPFDINACPQLPTAVNCPAGLGGDGAVCVRAGQHEIRWSKPASPPPNADLTIAFTRHAKNDICDTSQDADDKLCRVRRADHFKLNGAVGLVFKYDMNGHAGCPVLDPYIIVM